MNHGEMVHHVATTDDGGLKKLAGSIIDEAVSLTIYDHQHDLKLTG